MATPPTPTPGGPTEGKLSPSGLGRRVVGAVLVTAGLATVSMLVSASDPGRSRQGVSAETLLQAATGALSFVVLAVVGGWALLELARGKRLAFGVVATVGVVAEIAVRMLEPLWVPWLPSISAMALVHPGGLTLELFRNRGLLGWDGPAFVHVGQLQGGAVLAVLTAAVVLGAAARRAAQGR